MGDVTKIQWCHHTFNPYFAQWGTHGTRIRTSPANWKRPIKWNREAEADGVRRRVFCASLADVFEDWPGKIYDSRKVSDDWSNDEPFNPVLWHRDDIGVCTAGQTTVNRCRGERLATMNDLRVELFNLTDSTPWLDWMLLTKRPENVPKMWPRRVVPRDRSDSVDCVKLRNNVWLGTSISDQATADQMLPALIKCRDLSPVLFVSAEPLIGPINFRWTDWHHKATGETYREYLERKGSVDHLESLRTIDLVIVGGESGPNARPCAIDWIRTIIAQCYATGVACFVKQLGAVPYMVGSDGERFDWPCGYQVDSTAGESRTWLHLNDRKGGDPAEWPEDLRVREFPEYAMER